MSSLRQVLAFSLTLLMVVNPFLFGGLSWATTPDTVTLTTSAADATIDQANPTTNFGSGASLGTAGGASIVQRSVVRFDLSTLANQGVAVKAATLTMTLTDPPGASRTIEVHNLTTPFVEGTVTYNSPWTTAGGDFGASLITQTSGTTRAATRSWADASGALAAAVQGWFTTNTGFLLKDATETTNNLPTITHAQTVTGATTTGNTVASGSITAEDGDVYVAAVGLSNSGGRSVTGIGGPPGLTWSSLTGQLSDDFLHRVEFWTSSGTPTANGAVTATVSGASGAQSIVVSRYTGVNPDSPIGASAQTLSSGAATAVSLVLNTLTNNSMPLGATGEVAASATPGAAYTEDGDTGVTTEGVELERHTAVVASPSAVTVNATLSSAQHWSMIAAELKQEMAPRWGSRESTGNTPSLVLQLDRAPTGMTMTASPAPGISEVALNWGFGGGGCGPGGANSYRGNFFTQAVPGNTNSTVPPTDGTAFPVLGSTLASGDVVIFESGNNCLTTTNLENGPDVSILPGQSNTVMGFTFDNNTIAGAAVTGAPHYSNGLAVSGTTNSPSGGTKLWSYKTAATTFAAPGLTGSGVIVTAGNDSKLHGMSSSTGGRNYHPGTVVGTDPGALGGAVQSRPPVIPKEVTSNPTCANVCDVVYVGAGDGRVYAFRTDTGAQLWQSAVLLANASIQGAAAVQLKFYSSGLAQDTVIVGTHLNSGGAIATGNAIFFLNGDTGAVLFQCDATHPVGFVCGNMDIISSTPVVDYATNNVWVTSRSNGGTQASVWRVDTTNGHKVAGITLAGGNSTNVDASATLSYGNSGGASSPPVFVYVLTGNSAGAGDLRVIDPSTNTQVATTALTGAGFANTFPLPFFDGTAAGCDDIYLTTGGTTKGVHRRTFKRAAPVGFGSAPCNFANNSWDRTAGIGATPSTPIDNGFPSPSAMYFGSSDGLIHKIKTSDGTDAAGTASVTVNAGSQLGDISTDGSNLYIGDAAGRIYAFPTF